MKAIQFTLWENLQVWRMTGSALPLGRLERKDSVHTLNLAWAEDRVYSVGQSQRMVHEPHTKSQRRRRMKGLKYLDQQSCEMGGFRRSSDLLSQHSHPGRPHREGTGR